MQKMLNKYLDLIKLFGSVLIASVTLTAFAYQEFSTKKDLVSTEERINTKDKDRNEGLEKRLDRIENKLDRIIERHL